MIFLDDSALTMSLMNYRHIINENTFDEEI